MQPIAQNELAKYKIAKEPWTAELYKDEEWFVDGNFVLLVGEDRTDSDFFAMIFADEHRSGHWRPIDFEISIPTRKAAESRLGALIAKHRQKSN